RQAAGRRKGVDMSSRARSQGVRTLLLAVACLQFPFRTAAQTPPDAGLLELQVDNVVSFPSSGSYVRVRENTIEGTRLRFRSDLGVNVVQIPELWATYWLTAHDALQLQFDYFVAQGSQFLGEPVFYNGSTIAGGQTINASGSPWATLGLYYERRLLPS